MVTLINFVIVPGAHGYMFCSFLKVNRWYRNFIVTGDSTEEEESNSCHDDDDRNEYKDDSFSDETE